jgi:hypothetical protein
MQAPAAILVHTLAAKNQSAKPLAGPPISAHFAAERGIAAGDQIRIGRSERLSPFLRILGAKVHAEGSKYLPEALHMPVGVHEEARQQKWLISGASGGARSALRAHVNGSRERIIEGSALDEEPQRETEPLQEPLEALLKDGRLAAKRKLVRLRTVELEEQTASASAEGAQREKSAGPAAKRVETATDPRQLVARSGARPPEQSLYVLDLRGRNLETAGEGIGEISRAPRTGGEREQHSPSFFRSVPGREISSAGFQSPRPAGRTPFAGPLERLREMAGSELMRATGIILRDGGGEIRLVLKPESLGSIRIRMNLVDNAIEGRIIVENPAVKQVLDGSLDSLARALTAQGFQSASLEVAVGGQGSDNGRPEQQPTAVRRQESVEGFERSLAGVENVDLGDLLVNLFV